MEKDKTVTDLIAYLPKLAEPGVCEGPFFLWYDRHTYILHPPLRLQVGLLTVIDNFQITVKLEKNSVGSLEEIKSMQVLQKRNHTIRSVYLLTWANSEITHPENISGFHTQNKKLNKKYTHHKEQQSIIIT